MAIDIGLRKVIEYVLGYPIILVGAFCIYLVLYFISVFFFGPKKGRNPFNKDYRRPPEPFVHDTKARDAVLKQKFKAGKVPDDLDAIIIGSGAGGLTTGALLSRAGKKVLVLEQHDQAGGCCHSFVEKGFEFDTGIHYIGNLHDGTADRVLLDSLTAGQLRWAKMDDEFDTVVLGEHPSTKRYPMKSGKKCYIQNLIDMFPNEKEAIDKYMDLIGDAASSFLSVVLVKTLPKRLVQFLIKTGLYKLVLKGYRKGYTTKTLQEVLDGLTSNQELKAVLSYICGDYGIFPKEAPFILHAILIKHYWNGSYYPRGGTSEIAFHLIPVIQKAGGRVLVQAPVTEIICNDKGRAIGVTVNPGGKEEVKLYAHHIVSDAGAVNTFKTLLPRHIAEKSCIYPLIDKIGPSFSFITTFVGIDGSQEELKLPAGNTWAYQSNDLNKSMDDFMSLKTDDVEDSKVPLCYISFPSAKDPEWSNRYPGKSSALIITLGKWEWFKEWKTDKLRHRGDRYEGIKDSLGRTMWQNCVELFPQLDGKMVYMEVGTPVTNQHYLACPEGEMYGLNQGRDRFEINAVFKLQSSTDIPGLVLTGQDTMACGFASALMMGVFSASTILHRNLYFDLLKLQKQLNSKNGVSNNDKKDM